MRVIGQAKSNQLRQLMQDICVDPYGIKIMLPKAFSYLISLNSVSNICANILKQEMLSLGGDVAISRDSLTGKAKITDSLIMGNLAQYNCLIRRLKHQPFGLGAIAEELANVLANYRRQEFDLFAGRHRLRLGPRPLVMGIINLTPDSFSADGFYKCATSKVLSFAQKMVDDGADIIDIGAESTRPGARPISVKEESSRLIPVLKVLAKRIKVPISVDSYKPQVARRDLENGASIINDITGLRNKEMVKVAAQYKCAVIIMHMQGEPISMQKNPRYDSLLDNILNFLQKSINLAQDNGVGKDSLLIDPGIGFGKSFGDNLNILKNLSEFKVLGKPIVIGTSRKSFLGRILKKQPQERLFGTVASCCLAVKNGASIVRVHDTKEMAEAIKVLRAIEN